MTKQGIQAAYAEASKTFESLSDIEVMSVVVFMLSQLTIIHHVPVVEMMDLFECELQKFRSIFEGINADTPAVEQKLAFDGDKDMAKVQDAHATVANIFDAKKLSPSDVISVLVLATSEVIHIRGHERWTTKAIVNQIKVDIAATVRAVRKAA